MRQFCFILLFATFSSQVAAAPGYLDAEYIRCIGGNKHFNVSWTEQSGWSSNSINLYRAAFGGDIGTDVDDWTFELGNLSSNGCTTGADYVSAQFAMFAVVGSSEVRDAWMSLPTLTCSGQPQ